MPAEKTAKADVQPVRQRTQYTCMSASMAMALRALGHDTDEDTVNKVMGARPMQGASWEQALACAQHYGMRATLTVPCTLGQLKAWTDKGIPVLIAWNPEGREWSHASLVFDVKDDGTVYIADPNIPDPEETVRVVPKADFYARWYEKWPNYLVRRPAMAIDREVTVDGRQVIAHLTQPLMTRRDYGVADPMKTSEMSDLLKTAVNLPPDVERYVEEGKDQGLDEGAAWAVAWSRYCKFKNPGSEHCQKPAGDYFPGKSAGEKEAKFEKGITMTLDEVAKVVGPEFKEMNENPPESVVKVREDMGKQAAINDTTAAGLTKHLVNPKDPKHFLCGENADKKTTVDSVKDATCYYCKQAWEKSHGGHMASQNLIAMDLFADMLKDSKFEKGKPADPTVNMSPADAKEWDRQTEEHKDEFKGAGDPEPDMEAALTALLHRDDDVPFDLFFAGKTAGAGKYGFTKAAEEACTSGVNKLQKAAKRIAGELYAKASDSPAFLSKHAARSGNKAASMLLKAMEDLGPAADVAKLAKTAGRSGNGMYGFSEKTARLGMDACNALHHEAGVIAADLFARKGANPAHLAGYLSANAKKAKCAYSAMLAEASPDVELDVTGTLTGKTAGDFLASEEEVTDETDVEGWELPGTSKC